MDYPKTLTEKDWQKHKGILAKIIKESKKSGVGDKLTECESAHAALMDRVNSLPTKSAERAEAWKGVCKNEGKALVKALEAAAELADEKSFEWGMKQSMVPKSTVTAVSDVAKAARNFIGVVENYLEITQENINELAEKERETLEKQMQLLIEMFEDSLKSAYTDSKKAVKEISESLVKQDEIETTKKIYNDAFSGGNGVGRRLATALRSVQMAKRGGVDIDDPQAIITALDPWSTKNLMSAPSTATDIQKSILEYAVQLKKVSGAYKAYVK